MILRCYAIYDKAVGAFMQPFFVRADGEAKRMLLASIKGQKEFGDNARDYELFFLAEWNDATGDFGVSEDQKLSVPYRIWSGLEALQALEQSRTGVGE